MEITNQLKITMQKTLNSAAFILSYIAVEAAQTVAFQ